jgi:thioredoxin reductase (NADPH)
MAITSVPLLIIGSGPAGYTAAIYSARASLSPTLITGMEPGGQLMITTDVENYPGFSDVIQGPWLMTQMSEQARKVGTHIVNDYVNFVDFSSHPFIVKTEGGQHYEAQSVIISTGAQAKWLGIESEKKFRGFGVSGCATCDGFFFRGKTVAVVGGGNTAVEEALYLTRHAKEVYLIHRRETLRAEKILQERLLSHPQIKILWNHQVKEIIGDEKPLNVTGIDLIHTQNGEISHLKVDGVFIAIGHRPMTDVFKGQIDLDEEGYILCKPGTTETSVPGVFAAGDVQDKIYRQAVTAAGQGCMAALDVEKFLSHKTSPKIS